MIRIIRTPVRVLVFIVCFVITYLEMAADWIIGVRARTEYVREGKCKRCGRCCQALALIMPRGMARRDWLVRAVSWCHGVALNFYYIAEEENWLIYGCNYYKNGCSIYPFRHRICRSFPRQQLYGHPNVHPDCGFSFVRRDVWERRRAEKEAGKTPFDAVIARERAALAERRSPAPPSCTHTP